MGQYDRHVFGAPGPNKIDVETQGAGRRPGAGVGGPVGVDARVPVRRSAGGPS